MWLPRKSGKEKREVQKENMRVFPFREEESLRIASLLQHIQQVPRIISSVDCLQRFRLQLQLRHNVPFAIREDERSVFAAPHRRNICHVFGVVNVVFQVPWLDTLRDHQTLLSYLEGRFCNTRKRRSLCTRESHNSIFIL